jgi:F-type H+-transporting ATPase subunit c
MRKTWLIPLLSVLAVFTAQAAFAQEGGGDAGFGNGLIALAAGLGLGIAAVGAGLGQGRAVAAAMESIGRNPNSADRIQTPMIIGIAFMEALAIYALVIAFQLAERSDTVIGSNVTKGGPPALLFCTCAPSSPSSPAPLRRLRPGRLRTFGTLSPSLFLGFHQLSSSPFLSC